MKLAHYARKTMPVRLALVAALLFGTAGAFMGRPMLETTAPPHNGLPAGSHLIRASWQQGSATATPAVNAADLYQEKCAMCHQADRAGVPPAFPSLIGVGEKFSDAEMAVQIRQGKGRMPAFPKLSDDEVAALVAYIKTPAKPATVPLAGDASPSHLVLTESAAFLVIAR